MLKDARRSKVTIEGHTDNVGSAETNKASEREARGGGAEALDRAAKV